MSRRPRTDVKSLRSDTHLRLNPELKRDLTDMAERAGVTFTHLVEQGIRMVLAQEQGLVNAKRRISRVFRDSDHADGKDDSTGA